MKEIEKLLRSFVDHQDMQESVETLQRLDKKIADLQKQLEQAKAEGFDAALRLSDQLEEEKEYPTLALPDYHKQICRAADEAEVKRGSYLR